MVSAWGRGYSRPRIEPTFERGIAGDERAIYSRAGRCRQRFVVYGSDSVRGHGHEDARLPVEWQLDDEHLRSRPLYLLRVPRERVRRGYRRRHLRRVDAGHEDDAE